MNNYGIWIYPNFLIIDGFEWIIVGYLVEIWTNNLTSETWRVDFWTWNLKLTLMVFFFFFFSLSHFIADSLDVLHMAWICCHSATAIHAPANRRSRYDNNTLFVCIGIISSTLHSELDLSLFRGRLFPTSFCCCWNNSDHAIFGFLLHLLHQVSGCANAHWTLGYLLTTLFFLFTGLWKARGSNSLCRAF